VSRPHPDPRNSARCPLPRRDFGRPRPSPPFFPLRYCGVAEQFSGLPPLRPRPRSGSLLFYYEGHVTSVPRAPSRIFTVIAPRAPFQKAFSRSLPLPAPAPALTREGREIGSLHFRFFSYPRTPLIPFDEDISQICVMHSHSNQSLPDDMASLFDAFPCSPPLSRDPLDS